MAKIPHEWGSFIPHSWGITTPHEWDINGLHTPPQMAVGSGAAPP